MTTPTPGRYGQRWLTAASMTDRHGPGACMSMDCWDIYDAVYPETLNEIPGMYDATLCVLFLREMERTGDLPALNSDVARTFGCAG